VELTMAEIRSRSAVIAALETKGAVKIAGAMYNLESAAVEFLPSPKP
jgi:carbonic anhydrase